MSIPSIPPSAPTPYQEIYVSKQNGIDITGNTISTGYQALLDSCGSNVTPGYGTGLCKQLRLTNSAIISLPAQNTIWYNYLFINKKGSGKHSCEFKSNNSIITGYVASNVFYVVSGVPPVPTVGSVKGASISVPGGWGSMQSFKVGTFKQTGQYNVVSPNIGSATDLRQFFVDVFAIDAISGFYGDLSEFAISGHDAGRGINGEYLTGSAYWVSGRYTNIYSRTGLTSMHLPHFFSGEISGISAYSYYDHTFTCNLGPMDVFKDNYGHQCGPGMSTGRFIGNGIDIENHNTLDTGDYGVILGQDNNTSRVQFTATFTGSVMSGVVITNGASASLLVGSQLSGTGITPGTIVKYYDAVNNKYYLSKSAQGASGTINSFSQFYNDFPTQTNTPSVSGTYQGNLEQCVQYSPWASNILIDGGYADLTLDTTASRYTSNKSTNSAHSTIRVTGSALNVYNAVTPGTNVRPVQLKMPTLVNVGCAPNSGYNLFADTGAQFEDTNGVLSSLNTPTLTFNGTVDATGLLTVTSPPTPIGALIAGLQVGQVIYPATGASFTITGVGVNDAAFSAAFTTTSGTTTFTITSGSPTPYQLIFADIIASNITPGTTIVSGSAGVYTLSQVSTSDGTFACTSVQPTAGAAASGSGVIGKYKTSNAVTNASTTFTAAGTNPATGVSTNTTPFIHSSQYFDGNAGFPVASIVNSTLPIGNNNTSNVKYISALASRNTFNGVNVLSTPPVALTPVGTNQNIVVTGYEKVTVTPAAAASISTATFSQTFGMINSDKGRNGVLYIVAGNTNLTIVHTASGGGANTFVLLNGASTTADHAGQIFSFIYDTTNGNNQFVQVNGTANVSTKLNTKIKYALSRSKLSNPFANAPWIASPTWLISTAYSVLGMVVTGSGANSGNLYILDAAGTSGGSGSGPSGTGVGPITDGTCTWYFYGLAKAISTNPPAPALTYTNTTGGGLSKRYAYNSGAFFYSNGIPTVSGGNSYIFPLANIAPSVGNAGGTYNGAMATVSFKSDAPSICINGSNVQYSNTCITIECDGQFIQLGALAPPATYNPGGFLINWNGERKMRHYRVTVQANFVFYGVYVDSASTVFPDVQPNRIRVALNGDSLIAGANNVPYQGQSWFTQLGYILGWDDIYSFAVGGTGFIANAGGTATTFAQRIPDIAAINPDLHIVFGNHNDGGTSAARVAAVQAYIAQSLASMPGTKIIFLGTDSGNSGVPATIQQELDIQTAVNSFTTSQVVFIPVSTDVVPWFSGTGTVSAPVGDGNADAYVQPSGTHPTQQGVNYQAARIADGLINYFNSI